jgi:hypothetical protein
MDTKEIENECCHRQERRNPFFIAGGAIPAAQHFHGRGRLLGGDRDEAKAALAVRQDFDNLMVASLPFADLPMIRPGKERAGDGSHRE